MVTMSQKSSVPQAAKSVSQSLMPDTITLGANAVAGGEDQMCFQRADSLLDEDLQN
jgi:hypothetical protein